jgi:hypothetical protein
VSKTVLFNGAQIVLPGGYSRVDASQFNNTPLTGTGIVGLIGSADDGEPHTVQTFFTASAVKAFYGSGDLVEAAAMVASPGNDDIITNGAAAIVCYKVNNSTRASRTIAPFVFTSRKYGLFANNVQIGVAAPAGTQRIVTVTDIDAYGATITEVSPTLGSTPRFAIQYIGAGSAATLTTSATQFTTTVTGGGAGEGLTLNFADFPNLAVMLQYIASYAPNGVNVYSITSIV